MVLITVTRGQLLRKAAFVALLALLVGITSSVGGRAIHTGANHPETQPLTRAATTEPRVALTFDITWGHEELDRIVAVLQSQGIKATFFVGGTFLSHSADRIKALAASGHEVGTLGQKIVDLSLLPEQEVVTNLLASQSALSKILGGPVRYFRPPQGPATPEIVRGARTARLITVTHSLDSEDHRGLEADRIARRVVQRARQGDIIHLSASDWSKETSKALPAIISGLKERGLTPLTLSELAPADVAP